MQIGHIVRPTSRYNSQTLEVQRFALRTPRLPGTVRGKLSTTGTNRVTISTNQLHVFTVTVPDSAEVIVGGRQATFRGLIAGDTVISGRYRPDNRQVLELEAVASPVLRASGTISSLDRDRGVLSLIGSDAGPVELLISVIPTKLRSIVVAGDVRSFDDLQVGDEVPLVIYHPNKVVLAIAVAP